MIKAPASIAALPLKTQIESGLTFDQIRDHPEATRVTRSVPHAQVSLFLGFDVLLVDLGHLLDALASSFSHIRRHCVGKVRLRLGVADRSVEGAYKILARDDARALDVVQIIATSVRASCLLTVNETCLVDPLLVQHSLKVVLLQEDSMLGDDSD